MASSTLRFLQRAGLRRGASCLDVGCGEGQTTIEMARAVGATGRVTGVDLDNGALDIARRAADAAGVPTSFLHADAGRDGLPDTGADLGFARLVLSHLVDPMGVVRAMAAAVRPGGIAAVEDIFTPTLRSEPPVPALDDLIDLYCATVRFHGGDPTIGPRPRGPPHRRRTDRRPRADRREPHGHRGPIDVPRRTARQHARRHRHRGHRNPRPAAHQPSRGRRRCPAPRHRVFQARMHQVCAPLDPVHGRRAR
ncbi:class I SAM-dependent methyltransferase [Actinomycetospora flava]|uniref:class I SAM-dependent methyltransferase n=1 Tax=Actinomycetospora flava TaxID=3129232 RepID=UPI0035A1D3D1